MLFSLLTRFRSVVLVIADVCLNIILKYQEEISVRDYKQKYDNKTSQSLIYWLILFCCTYSISLSKHVRMDRHLFCSLFSHTHVMGAGFFSPAA